MIIYSNLHAVGRDTAQLDSTVAVTLDDFAKKTKN